ncbi:MAG: tRNA pseudouridine(55) synthase TruB [Gaiellaceae bacterium]
MPARALEPSGLVLVDKPIGPSSFAIVRRLRTATGARAGHAGTLDPFASGLLLVLLGAATRLARYLVGLDKRYLTTVDLRRRTSTGDPEGEGLEEREPPSVEELEDLLSALRGEISLPIPAASAVKIDGERAYKLARRGVAVVMPERRSTVHELRLARYELGIAELELHVSSGTYVRAIADALGGHCLALRRLSVGPFDVGAADERRILPPADSLPFLSALELDEGQAAALRAGRPIAGTGEGSIRLIRSDRLVAIGRAAEGIVRPETVMPL